MFKNKSLTFILFLSTTFVASLIGSLSTINYKEPWYSTLVKPSFNPPDYIFAPVCTTLNLMMTIAIWIFWHSKTKDLNTVYIYFVHLILGNSGHALELFALLNAIALFLINKLSKRKK